MKSIVDQHGKPFKPNPFAMLSDRTLNAAAVEVLAAAKPSTWETNDKIAQLRQSCGAPLQTFTFRRHSPFAAIEPPAPPVEQPSADSVTVDGVTIPGGKRVIQGAAVGMRPVLRKPSR